MKVKAELLPFFFLDLLNTNTNTNRELSVESDKAVWSQ